MKLTVETDPALTETEIIIHCAKQDKQLERLIWQIRQCAFVFHGKSEKGVSYYVCLFPDYAEKAQRFLICGSSFL